MSLPTVLVRPSRPSRRNVPEVLSRSPPSASLHLGYRVHPQPARGPHGRQLLGNTGVVCVVPRSPQRRCQRDVKRPHPLCLWVPLCVLLQCAAGCIREPARPRRRLVLVVPRHTRNLYGLLSCAVVIRRCQDRSCRCSYHPVTWPRDHASC